MSIGLCCQFLQTDKKNVYVNALSEKTLRYGKIDQTQEQDVLQIWLHNVKKLQSFLPIIFKYGYKNFRISSSLLPLFDFFPALKVNNSILYSFEEIGKFALSNNMRLTMHPDQFVVLSSDSDQVIQNSIKMLEMHAWIMDCMNLPQTPYYAINIHGGKRGNLHKLIETIKKLPHNVKNRLTLENDELCYNVDDLMQVFDQTGVPICFDSHHHLFNNANLTIDNALELAIKTWPKDVKSLTHLSNSEKNTENGSFKDKRKHSEYVHYIPEIQKQLNNSGLIDIDFEFKMKNVAIDKACIEFNLIK